MELIHAPAVLMIMIAYSHKMDSVATLISENVSHVPLMIIVLMKETQLIPQQETNAV